ncbi:gelsolin-like protein 2 [Amphiura filiformis]|uniref:gelsolin-like protein 2 n=1 Tax=Amphiura filiformis TaxID=82378 RepID=UPI003B21CF78
MIKAKKYNWKDSNLALFGSDVEKQVKKDAAKTELAWKDAGKKPGLQIWRIVKFKVVAWPRDDYGKFYNGDSYIILKTYKKKDSDELHYDLHFWIGADSTQDEYGTAAYKTVELDQLLDDKPVQHREVMDHESDMFKTYFPTITKMEGGADTGFRHVKPRDYKPRLLQFKGSRRLVSLRERPLSKHSLDGGDVFILDNGLDIYQWNGDGSNKDERMRAMQYLQQLKSERGRARSETIDQRRCAPEHPFMKALSDAKPEEEDQTDAKEDTSKPAMFRLRHEANKLTFSQVAEGDLPKAKLDNNFVFVVDTKKELYVWIGRGANKMERQNAMAYAHNYLRTTGHPFIPIACINEAREPDAFWKVLV